MMPDQARMSGVAAEFPRLDREAVELANLLATRALTIRPRLGESERTLFLVPSRSLREPRAVVTCRLDDHPALLSIEEDQLHQFLPDLAAGTRLSTLTGALAMAVAEVGFRPLLDALAERLTTAIEIEAANGVVPADWPGIALCPDADQAMPALAFLHLSPGAAGTVIERLRAAPAAPAWAGAEAAPVPLAAHVGCVPLSVAEISLLALGDVILLADSKDRDRVAVVAGNRSHRIGSGRFEGRTVTLERLLEGAMAGTEETDSGEAPAETEGDGAPIAVEDIEVRLSFSLGHRMVTVAELRTLAPGYTFDLPDQGPGDVSILANGREIGRGELVEIDDRLGVRILRLTETSDV